MKRTSINFGGVHNDESGAALVMVILISLLLVTAVAAMLSAVGASARNNSDALSEAKAYWAAESGLQAVINVLRHHVEGDLSSVEYNEATDNPDLSNWLTYNDDHRVIVNSDPANFAAYEITLSDPDFSAISTTYTSTAGFQQTSLTPLLTTYTFHDADPANNNNRTEITWVPPADPVTINHDPPPNPFPALGNFRVTTYGTGGTINATTPMLFRLDYRMSSPRSQVVPIRGSLVIQGGIPMLKFDFYNFRFAGNSYFICQTDACLAARTTPITLTIPGAGSTDIPVFLKIGASEPWRLKVKATGYGPNGARKELEGIIQKNIFNDFSTANAITLVGRTTNPDGTPCMVWDPGTSKNVEIDGGQAPSVGVADTDGLDQVLNPDDPFNGTMTPAPAIYGEEIPEWQKSASALHDMVMTLRTMALKNGRLFTNRSPTDAEGWGNFNDNPVTGEKAGTGITFCEGDCEMKGNNAGGGILVITGTFYTSGAPKFRGLVLAVGPYRSADQPGGIERGGGGNEIFVGGVVIAPYFPENLAGGFGCPRYIQDGGPGDTENEDLDITFDNTPTITNVMRGIAEK